jgi:hypothetical protein
MIPNDLLTRLANALRVNPAQLLTAEPSRRNLEIPWAVGEKVSAVVQSNLPGGRTLATVGELPLDLKLPFPVKPGEQLNLTLIARQPGFVFALSDASRQAEPVKLSPSGQKIGELVNQLVGQKSDQQKFVSTETMAVSKPLLPQPTLDTVRLAQVLRQGIAQSGLFYESHQAQWVQGDRPRESLLQEPQGKLPPLRDRQEASVPRPDDRPNLTTQQLVAGTTASADNSVGATPVKIVGEMVHPDTVPQVQQQLQSLDSRQVVWQGQPWPGMPVEWRIDDPPQREADSESEMTWNTSLTLTLPTLGGVRARLALSGNQIRLQLGVDKGETRTLLTQNVAGLTQGLADSGLVLGRLTVDVDVPT